MREFIEFLDKDTKESNEVIGKKPNDYLINNAKHIFDIKQVFSQNKNVCFKFNDIFIVFEDYFSIIEFLDKDESFIDNLYGEGCKKSFENVYSKIDKDIPITYVNMLEECYIIKSINKRYWFKSDNTVFNAPFIITLAIILYNCKDCDKTKVINDIKNISDNLYHLVDKISYCVNLFDLNKMKERAFAFKI